MYVSLFLRISLIQIRVLYFLKMNTYNRPYCCAPQSKSITVSVPRLSPEDFHATLSALRAARAATRRPLSPEEAEKFPRYPSNAFEFFSYAEHCMRRAICALKLLPDFRALNNDDQTAIVKASHFHYHKTYYLKFLRYLPHVVVTLTKLW